MQEKPKEKSHWTEKSGRPIAGKYMQPGEIRHFREVLAQSYKCEQEEILYTFEKIMDENDEDRDDCLLLTYRMKDAIMDGKKTGRTIFRVKMHVPEYIKKHAEELRSGQFDRSQTRKICAPSAGCSQGEPIGPVKPNTGPTTGHTTGHTTGMFTANPAVNSQQSSQQSQQNIAAQPTRSRQLRRPPPLKRG